jgi:hypothetical protein
LTKLQRNHILLALLYIYYANSTIKFIVSTKVNRYNKLDQGNQYTCTGNTLGRRAHNTIKLVKNNNQACNECVIVHNKDFLLRLIEEKNVFAEI